MLRNIKRYTGIMLILIILLLGCILMMSTKAGAESRERQSRFKTIKVEAGDTLWSIAGDYQEAGYKDRASLIQGIRKMNHLDGNTIYSDRNICVPYYTDE